MKQAAGLILWDGRRLLLRKPTGHFGGYFWTFPKGRIDPGESPEEAALRETLERGGKTRPYSHNIRCDRGAVFLVDVRSRHWR